MSYVVGIDTGGTFTDVIAIDESGMVTSGKSPTTPEDLTTGILGGIAGIAERLETDVESLLGETDVLRFSGTTATNALITRNGDPTGMITTAGFEDTLAIARANSSWAGLSEAELRRVHRQLAAEPLIPRNLIYGVAERVDTTGREVLPLDRNAVEHAIDQLVQAGVLSVAVCFLWSIRNAAHELEAAEIIRARYPELPVHCSHDVAPAVGEYERFATAAADAYVSPALTRFLLNLRRRLAESNFTGQLLVAQADGGALYPEDARPVFTLDSGPAGGVIASRTEGTRLGFEDVLTTDVGGTSFDVGVIARGSWMYAKHPQIGGHHLSIPMIEVASIGAGGGSLAWADGLGVLHVGPRSAGSRPGPACYGRGGSEPTVTDADLVLGYLDPDGFLGGRMKLDVAAAERAVQSVAAKVGLETVEAAAGIFAIANSHMGDLLARQVVARGYDPRDFVVFAYGGAGPMHCAFYGTDAGAREIVIPAKAGTFSALGVATAPLRHAYQRHTFSPMPVLAEEFNGALAALEARVTSALDKDSISQEHREISYVLEMRYGMQIHTVQLTVPARAHSQEEIDTLGEAFDSEYERIYGAGSGYPAAGRFLTGYTVEGYGHVPLPSSRIQSTADSAVEDRALLGVREAYFDGAFIETNIYGYEALAAGDQLNGPAIIEARETTIVIPPGVDGRVDEFCNVRLTRAADEDVVLSGAPGSALESN
jgi:N-methylhydantoinase A